MNCRSSLPLCVLVGRRQEDRRDLQQGRGQGRGHQPAQIHKVVNTVVLLKELFHIYWVVLNWKMDSEFRSKMIQKLRNVNSYRNFLKSGTFFSPGMFPRLGRDMNQKKISCMAQNNEINPPKTRTVKIKMNCEYLWHFIPAFF